MNKATAAISELSGLTLTEVVGVSSAFLESALKAASASRTLTPKILEGLYNGPLARDLLLSWVSQAMAARAQLQFWMEINDYAIGLQVRTLGMSYTRGSVLLMELIELLPTIAYLTEMLCEVYGIPDDALIG